MKRIAVGFMFVGLLFIAAHRVSAADFKLWRIGSLDTGGKQYNIWYYTGHAISLFGTAGEGSNVDIYVDDSVHTVRAENTGNWSYDVGTLKDGNHHFTLSSEANSYSFVLSLSPNAAASASAQLPVTGAADAAILSGIGAAALLGFGYYLKRSAMVS